MKIIKNPNKEQYEQATLAVKQNGGYRLDCKYKNSDNVCLCLEFLDSNKLGVCYCGRYVKTEL